MIVTHERLIWWGFVFHFLQRRAAEHFRVAGGWFDWCGRGVWLHPWRGRGASEPCSPGCSHRGNPTMSSSAKINRYTLRLCTITLLL